MTFRTTGWRNRQQYLRLPASVLARRQCHSTRLTYAAPNHRSIHPFSPTHAAHVFPHASQLADLRSAPLSWHLRVTRRGRMWWRTNPVGSQVCPLNHPLGSSACVGRACSVLNVAMPLLCNTPNLTGLAQRHGSFAIRRQVETPPWTGTSAELSRSTD